MFFIAMVVLLTCQLDFTSASITCTSGWDVINRPSVEINGWIFASPDAKFDCDGILTEWRFQSKASNPFKAIVWRHITLTQFSVVGINTITGGYPVDQEVVHTVPEEERINVRAGDVIGWAFPGDGTALQYTDTLGGTQVLYKLDTTEPLVQDSLTQDQFVDINFGGHLRDYSIKATVSGTNCSSGWLIQDRLANDGGDLLAVSPNSPFSCNGILTQWRYQSKHPEPFKALVFRPIPSVGPTSYTLIGINDIPVGAINEEVVHTVPGSEQIYVQAGDVIGWSYPTAVQAALQFDITSAPTEPVDTLIHVLFYDTNENNLHDKFKLNHVYNVSSDQYYREYSIMATVGVATGLCPANWTQWGTKCCPTGWDNRDNKCYHFNSDNGTSRNYQTSKAYCNSIGGRLATVQSDEEMVFVSQTYSGEYYWGCTDISSEGFWKCEGYDETMVFYDAVRGAFIGYWDWKIDISEPQPNNGNAGEHCINTYWDPRKYYDVDCSDESPDVLCEQDAITVGDTGTANEILTSPCDTGWPTVDRAQNDAANYTSVAPHLTVCQPGRIVKWTYVAGNSVPFRALILRPAGSATRFTVVGMHDIPAGPTGVPVTVDVTESDQIVAQAGDVIGWSHGPNGVSVVDFEFADNGPNTLQYHGNIYSTMAIGDTLDFDDWAEQRYYSILATVSIVCPDNYDLLGNKCYHYRDKVSVSYQDLISYCQAIGGRPIVFLSQAEMDSVIARYPIAWGMWIGCRDNNPTEGYWTCEGYDSADVHYTVVGSSAGYWNWRIIPLEPNNGGGNEHCVYMTTDPLREWNDTPCSANMANLLCEADIITGTSTSTSTSTETPTSSTPSTTISTSPQPPETQTSRTNLLEGTSKWYNIPVDVEKQPIADHCLDVVHLDTIPVRSIEMCAAFCQRHPLCVAFNFGTHPTGDKYCELNEVRKDESAPADFKAVNDCMYFEQL